jgi:glycosyltransferase involved in cell wall biosynthesis
LAGNNKNIIFTGFITGKLLYELFSNCYLFVFPSEVEGLPTALLEAMSYGKYQTLIAFSL